MPSKFLSPLFLVIAFSSMFCNAQEKQRVAVYPFDDRTTAKKDMNIGTKLADQLIAQLATNGAFTILDRQYVDKLLAEKNLKYDPNFDSAAAVKSGLMGTVDVLITGQIDSFNANTSEQTTNKIYVKKVETDGAVDLKATARLISVEKGSIIAAPSASSEQKAILAKNNLYMDNGTGTGAGTKSKAADADQALRQLVDKAADEVAKQLSTDISRSATVLPPPITVVSPTIPQPVHPAGSGVQPSFVGISDGLAFLDKGSSAGIKEGAKFIIRRSTETGLKNSAGQPILRHKDVCTLVVSVLEDSSAAGKCVPTQTAHGADGRTEAGG